MANPFSTWWDNENWDSANPFKPKSDDSGPSESEQAAAAEAALQKKKDAATADLNTQFDALYGDDYFKNIGRKYSNFAMNAPVAGIRDQRKAAMGDLIAQLARQGKLDSTVRADREALAKKLYAKGQVDAASKGKGIGDTVRGNLFKAKSAALEDIDAATNPEGAVNIGMSNIAQQTNPGTFNPMLDVFLKLTQGLAMRQEVERRKDRQAQIDSFLAGDRSKLVP